MFYPNHLMLCFFFSDCPKYVYPDNSGHISTLISDQEYIVISFDVTVFLHGILIIANNKFNKYLYELSFINRNSESFEPIDASRLKLSFYFNGTYTSTWVQFTTENYVTALKVSLNGTVASGIRNINTTTYNIEYVIGCPMAVFETGSTDTSDREWKIGLSDNKIETYPYLQMVPELDSQNAIDDILKNLDKHFTDSVTYDVFVGNSTCSYSARAIKIFLESDNNLAGIKIDNVTVSRKSDVVSVSVGVTALNQDEYTAAIVYVETRVTKAVESVQCDAAQFPLTQNEPEMMPSFSSEAASIVPTVFASVLGVILLLVILLVIGYVLFRRRRAHKRRENRSE